MTVRRAAASFIEAHKEDFEPFLDESLDAYVQKIRDTAEWGGQLELLALAKSYGVSIHVLQGDGRVETIEGDNVDKDKEIWLAYYRHSFGLGEHYNSLRKKAAS
jgi:OTU domain-containing protein 6